MTYEFKSIYFDNPIINGRIIDLFLPEKITGETAIFFVHVGGWTAGSRAGAHKIMREFNNNGYVCASVDYRLTGVKIWDQITDIRHGYDIFIGFLKENTGPLPIHVHGESAGAHLAALLSFASPGECGETIDFNGRTLNNNWVRPASVSLQSTPTTFEPWEDIFPRAWQVMQHIVGTPYNENPELYKKLSPIEYINEKSPHAFFLEAENEHMFPLENILEFVGKLKMAGKKAEYKIYTKAEHGFFYDVERRQQREAFTDILAFINKLNRIV